MLQLFMKVKRWWLYQVGRRGSALLFFALLNSFYCWSLLTLPPAAQLTPAFTYINGIAPIEVWAGIWGVVGFVCLICAFRKWDGVAFTAAIAIYLLWGMIYLTGDFAGYMYRGWVSSVVWFAFAMFVGLISGWPEYPGGDAWRQATSSRD